MNDTETNTAENAGDQDENENAAPVSDFAKAAAGLVDDVEPTYAAGVPKRPACGELVTHDRHVTGPASAIVHCAGWIAPEDVELTYVAAFAQWQAANPWSSTSGTMVHHARVLARKLDRAGDDAPLGLQSAYLQAISRLEKMRPGSTAPAGDGDDAGDGLGPQLDLFSPMDEQ